MTGTMVLNYGQTQQDVWFSARSSTGIIDITAQADSTPLNPVGVITRFEGNLYRYVYFVGGTTYAGAPAYWSSLDPSVYLDSTTAYSVHATATSAIDAKGYNTVAGVFLASTITAATYIWIQVGGIHTAALVGASTNFGDMQLGGSNAVFRRVAIGASQTDEVFGIALANISSSTAPMLILNCAW